MNEQITQATGTLDQIQQFLATHPIYKWMWLAWVFGWVLAIVARIFIKMSPWNETTERKLVFLSCVVFSGAAAYRLWAGEYPEDYPLIVATTIGGASPFAYMLLTELACRWKPELRAHLSLRKDFSAAIDDDDAPVETPKP